MPRLDLFIGHQSQIGFLSQHLLLFGQVFKVFDGFVHLGFPLHLTELLKGSVKLFFHRVVVQLHVVQLLLHFLRIHLFHELLHLLIDLAHLFAHDVVHELLQLFLFVQDAFLLFAELVRALVLALVVTAHFFEPFLQCLLLFHKVFHGRPVLPSHFTLLAQPLLHGLHRFPQLRSLLGGFFQGFFNALRGLDSLFSKLFRAWCRNARGGGPHHFGTVDAVVVPELKPTLQDISFPQVQAIHVPSVKERRLTATGNRQIFSALARLPVGHIGIGVQRVACVRPRTPLDKRPHKVESAEAIVVLNSASEIASLSRRAVHVLSDANGGFDVFDDPDAVAQRVANGVGSNRSDPVQGIAACRPVGTERASRSRADVHRLVPDAHTDIVGIGNPDRPLDGRAFRDENVALVALVDHRQSSVGWRRGLNAELGKTWHGKGDHNKLFRPPPVCHEPKRGPRTNRGKSVAKNMVDSALHPESAARRFDNHRAREVVTHDFNRHRKGLSSAHAEILVQQPELERCGFHKLCSVLDNPVGGLCHPSGSCPEQPTHNNRHGQRDPERPQRRRDIHRLNKGKRTQ